MNLSINSEQQYKNFQRNILISQYIQNNPVKTDYFYFTMDCFAFAIIVSDL